MWLKGVEVITDQLELIEGHKLWASGGDSCQVWRKGTLQGRYLSLRCVVHHEERYPASEWSSHTGGDLWWSEELAVIQRSRWIQMRATHVAKVWTGHTIVIWQLIGSNDLEKSRGKNGGWIGWRTLATWRKSLFLPMGLQLGHGETKRLSENCLVSEEPSQEFQQFKDDVSVRDSSS